MTKDERIADLKEKADDLMADARLCERTGAIEMAKTLVAEAQELYDEMRSM